jgi:hypothetical protein
LNGGHCSEHIDVFFRVKLFIGRINNILAKRVLVIVACAVSLLYDGKQEVSLALGEEIISFECEQTVDEIFI